MSILFLNYVYIRGQALLLTLLSNPHSQEVIFFRVVTFLGGLIFLDGVIFLGRVIFLEGVIFLRGVII